MNNSTASTTKAPESDGNNDSVAAFLSSFIFNAVIALIIILVFSYLRPKHEKIYQPYFKLLTEFLHDKIPEKRLSLLKKLTLSSSFFAWLTPAFKLNDNELYEVVGFDAFVYLRFIRLCFKILAFSLPYAAIVLIPINVVDGKGLTGLDRLTLGNISNESDKLWAHLIGVWIFSLILYYFMYFEWKVYVKYRQIFLKENSKQHFSVLVTQLPQEIDSDDKLKKFVDQLFPEKVAHSHIIRDLDEYRKLVQKHDQMVLKLEHAQAVFEEKGERPEHKLKPIIGEKVDSINYFDEQLRETQQELEKVNFAESILLDSAIVTFKSVRDARIASEVLWQAIPYNTFVQPAPEPHDVIWSNLDISVLKKWIRWTIISVCLFFLVIFWTIPVAFVSALVSLQSLQEKVEFLEFVNDFPAVLKGIIEGVLSTIALVIFFAILPMLMAFMSKKEGVITNSGVQKSVIGKMFIFIIVNKFLILVLSGAFLNQIQKIIDDPGSLPSLLAESLPAMALFFTNFAMLQALMGHALRLLRIAPLIIVSIKTKWLAKTPRELKNVWAPPSPNYGVMYPNDLYIFVIGVAYCIQAPYVIPFVMLYFGFGYLVHFYSFVYIMRPSFHAGGSMWPKVFNRMLLAIVVFQILMIGVFGLKKNPEVSALSLPPIFLTIIFKIVIMMYFERVAKPMELDDHKDEESENKEQNMDDKNDDAVDDKFIKDAHDFFIPTTTVPCLFSLSTDDPSEGDEPAKDDLKTTNDQNSEFVEDR